MDPDVSSLLAEVAVRLDEESPFGLMTMASGMIEATTPRHVDRWLGNTKQTPDTATLVQTFADSGAPELLALAMAITTMHSDELLGARLRRTAGSRLDNGGPAWLATMGDIAITETMLQVDPLGDGDNLMISWRWPNDQPATMVVYIDHNVGTIVKDAFAVEEDAEALNALYQRIGDMHVSVVPIAPADARSRITEAIERGEHTVPPFTSETWPTARPLLEWILGHLPTGGVGHVRPDWPQEDRQRLLAEFAASTFANVKGLTRPRVRELADPLVGFGCDYGPGDPLRWSSVSVEIMLTDWYQRKVLGLAAVEMRRVPDVLAAFVRFAHDRTGVPADLRTTTLQAVERWRPSFLRGVSGPARSSAGNAIDLARFASGLSAGKTSPFGVVDPFEDDDDDEFGDLFDDDDDDDDDDFFPSNLGHGEAKGLAYMAPMVDDLEAKLIELAGGPEAYATIDVAPLGDAEFNWSIVPPEIRDDTAESLAHLDRWAVELFDAEVRTIGRTVLAHINASDPRVYKRSPRPDALAAAV